jgi:ligand-binding sensor domain-containing protein
VWTSEDGLPQNSVNAIVQTRDGYLWLGTFGGLVRFDGLKFTVFNSGNTPGLKGNRILALYEDRAGTLWIGTESGEVMSLKDGQARTFTTADGLPGGLVRCFFEDQAGTLWIGTYSGLVRWQPGSVETYTLWDDPIDNWVWAIYEDRPGHLWIGMNGGLVEVSNGRAIPRDPSGNVWAILPGPQGSLLLGTGNGIVRFVNGQMMAYPRTKGLPTQSVRMFVEDRTGNVWIGYVEKGIISRWQAGASTDRMMAGKASGQPPVMGWLIFRAVRSRGSRPTRPETDFQTITCRRFTGIAAGRYGSAPMG